jgi:histone-lysine N-methyltransferase SETMAR
MTPMIYALVVSSWFATGRWKSLAPKLGGIQACHLRKSDISMEIEQRYVIKFFVEEGTPSPMILDVISRHYKEKALHRSAIYGWIAEVKRGRTDLSTISSPGRTPDEGLAAAIARKHEKEPRLSARGIARSLEISHETVCRYLSEVFGMKCLRLRWIPHTLSTEQKAKRAELAGAMLQQLAKHESSQYHFLLTGDESWIYYAYNERTMWCADWEEPDETERPSHYHRKTMVTVFFNGTGDSVIDILPEGEKMNAVYFAANIIKDIREACYPHGRNTHDRKFVLHLDNCPLRNTKTVADAMEGSDLKRMPHPPYSPDLAPCDFFLFGYLKQALIAKDYTSPEDLLSEVTEIIRAIPHELLSRVFQNWKERLEECWKSGGEYVE